MVIFAGVDGTGEAAFANDPGAYNPVYKNSHVNKLSRQLHWQPFGFYVRGPGLFGVETAGLAALALSHVLQFWNLPGVHKVFLAGFSRGAAAVIETARMLQQMDIPVECLILFDPVDRSHPGGVGQGSMLMGSNTPIVESVRNCIKVLRDPAAKSRETFGNCGKSYQSSGTVRFDSTIFATHGGVGGTPWDANWVPSGQPYIDEGKIPNIPGSGYVGGDRFEQYEPEGMTRVTPGQDMAGAQQSWDFVNSKLSPIVDAAIEVAAGNLEPTRDEGLAPGRTQINVRATHTVKPGESLSLIAMQYYGSFNRWGEIYQANLDTIGSNPNVIQPNMKLIIPV